MEQHDAPARARRAAPLSRSEKRVVGAVAAAPVLLAVVVLVPVAALTGAGPGEIAGAALVYGGLLGLAAGFVTVDRLQARQCPRCRSRQARGVASCTDCGYDLLARPRYACRDRHELHVEPGLCACGQRLEALPVATGVGREVAVALRIGGWLLAFLLAMGVLLRLLDANLPG